MATPLRAATATPKRISAPRSNACETSSCSNTSVGKNHAQSKNNTRKNSYSRRVFFILADIDSEKSCRQWSCFFMLSVYFQLQIPTCFMAWYVCFNSSRNKKAKRILLISACSKIIIFETPISRLECTTAQLKFARWVFKHNFFSNPRTEIDQPSGHCRQTAGK